MLTKLHPEASPDYIHIGNPSIIDVRSQMPVRLSGYGKIGDYVPFYFTPRSIMLYNIVTGYYAPVVPRRKRGEILVIRCQIEDLSSLPQWFFTDGQANDILTDHYGELRELNKIDWTCIQRSNFSKTDGDFDRQRRYQVEFLVRDEVPISAIESLNVYNQQAADEVHDVLSQNNCTLKVNTQPIYFF